LSDADWPKLQCYPPVVISLSSPEIIDQICWLAIGNLRVAARDFLIGLVIFCFASCKAKYGGTLLMEPATLNFIGTAEIGRNSVICREVRRGASLVLQYSIRPTRSRFVDLLFSAFLAVTISSYGGDARAAGPFERLSGEWAGKGSIELANGSREVLKCKAKYDGGAETLHIHIRCASDSYNFELSSNAKLADGAVTGDWSESPHGAFGSISGTAAGENIRVKAEAGSFTATLNLVTYSNSQTVVIKTASPDAGIKGATINLKRGS
jgi:hypothetical protein